MKIAVLIKQTPDTAELPKVSAQEASSGAVTATMAINPWDEYAAEEALALAERFQGETVAVSLARPTAVDALKHALAMGIDSALLVDPGERADLDSWATATALAAALQQAGEVDLVLAGKQSVDGNSGVVHAGVACKLGFRLLSNVTQVIDVADGFVTVARAYEGGQETVRTRLPAVLSVAKEINEPRYPSFMGIRKAGRAKIPALTLGELGLTDLENRSHWSNVRKPEQRQTRVEICEGETVAAKAARLVDALLAAKVI